MDMFNKLKNAVTNVLPGNPLSRDFDIYNQVGSAGPGLLWKVFAAAKKSTKEEASLFLFEKKSVERYSRQDRDSITELLRVGVQQLTKLRHPKILAVIHPLEESREALAFATEPVFASLSNILGNMTSLSSVPKDLQEYQLYDVEIKHGLLQLTESLCFLHNDAKMMHRNLCPEAIVLTKLGSWKLAGFDFCVRSTDPQAPEPSYPFQEWRVGVAPVRQPNLDYMAPEYVITMRCSPASDMFSLGLLIYSVFAKGKPLFQCQGEFSAFKQNAEELRSLRASLLGAVPDELREHIKLLLNTEPTVRPDAAQLSKVPFFEDVGCVTLQYIDSLFQRQNIEKSNFFKGLPKVISKLPKRVSLQRILPALFKEAMNSDMVPFLLPCILLVAEEATEAEYKSQILPQLIPLFKIKEPIQVVLLFLQNMTLLLSKTPNKDIQLYVLPMIFGSLEADSPQIQELCLSIIPTFVELIEYPTLKNSLVPRIKKLCLATAVLTVRVNCLLCMGQLMEHMDKWFVLDEILPFLQKIPTREPAVLMSILGIHKVAFEGSRLGITKDHMANKILPFLIPIALDNNLNLSQFNAFMGLVRDMLSKVEDEHRSKLEQLDQMKQEQRTLEFSRSDMGSGDLSAGNTNSMMDKFLSGFGLGGFRSSQTAAGGAGASSSSGPGTPSSSNLVPAAASSSAATAPSVIPPSKKTNLSLEEKQRLAKQQEQQQRFKSQASLSPAAKATGSGKTAASKPGGGGDKGGGGKGGAKDLTSTLMQSNVTAMKTMNVGGGGNQTPNYSSNTMNNNTHTAWGSSSSPQPGWSGTGGVGGGGFGSGGGGGGFNSSPGMGYGGPAAAVAGGPYGMSSSSFSSSPMGAPSQSQQLRPGPSPQQQQQQQGKVDASAFDSLLGPSHKPRPTMNQMGGGVRPPPQGFGQPPLRQPMGMMGMNAMGGGGGGGGNFMGGSPMGGNSMGMVTNSMGVSSPMMGVPGQQAGFGRGGGGGGAGGGAFPQMGMGMGGGGVVQGQNPGFGGQMLSPTGSMASSQKSSTNSLDDLLG